jgi:ketosteroid isomerase-like protein
VVCCLISLSACSRTKPLKTLDANEIKSLGNDCQVLYKAHIDAWNSKDPANLRQIYTEDIVTFEGEPSFVGIDDVVMMAGVMYDSFPNWQMDVGETYISQDECFGTWVNWGVFGFTKDDLGYEYDLMETLDGKISYWWLFYDNKFSGAFRGMSNVDNDLLNQFAASWSGRDQQEITNLYAPEAVLEDTLFGISITGQDAISAYARSFIASSPETSWTVLSGFVGDQASLPNREQYPYVFQGGIFSIKVEGLGGEPCEIRAAVVLTPDDDGIIQDQKIFYNVDSLLACGWAK